MAYQSNDQPSIDAVYPILISALNDKLGTQGYQLVHEQNDDAVFGSRYTIWSDNSEALRFTWDGKEGVFILAVADSLPLSSLSAWDDIILINYDPQNHSADDVSQITARILNSLDG